MNLLFATWLPSAHDLRLFSPELVLTGTIVAVLLVPLFTGRRAYTVALLVMAGALAGAYATFVMSQQVVNGAQSGFAPPGTAPLLLADGFTVFFKLFLFLLLILIVWLWMVGASQPPSAVDYGPRGAAPARGTPEFFLLLLTSALGMLLMVGTLNLLVIVIAIETASLPSYAIVASDRRSRPGAEAALKYAVFGAASAAIMVYGMSLLYGRFGTLDLGTIATQVAAAHGGHDLVFWLGLIAFGAGIAFKIAAVPMHLWCPDVFEGAPIEVTTWLSIASKAAGLGLLLRIVSVFAAASGAADILTPLTWGIGFIAALTCTVGNLAALRQDSVKRVLAYSSIAHAGYMMMAAAIIGRTDTGSAVNVGVAALVSYLFVYVTMNVGAFGATALVVWHAGTDHISAFTGLGRRAPWLAVPLAICLFSLVGLPPLGGFTAKWYLLLALGKSAATQPWLWVLVVVAVVNTAISLYYYVRIVRQMFLTEDASLAPLRAPVGGLAMINACAILLVLLGTLWFNPLGQRAQVLAVNLFEGAHATHTQDGPPTAAEPAVPPAAM